MFKLSKRTNLALAMLVVVLLSACVLLSRPAQFYAGKGDTEKCLYAEIENPVNGFRVKVTCQSLSYLEGMIAKRELVN